MPFCPKCKYEYVEGIEKCPDCDLKLVSKIHEQKQDEYIDEALVTVGSYATEIEAQEARIRLEGSGIECAVTGQMISEIYPSAALLELGGGIRVMVRESDADAARKALRQA